MTDKYEKYRPTEGTVIRSTESLSARSARALSLGMAKYYDAAFKRLNHLEYGDPTEYIRRKTGIETFPQPLDEVWTLPVFRRAEERGAEVGLNTVLSTLSTCVLVLAPPGHGKSTLARFLTCHYLREFKEGRSGCFGLYVPLSALMLFNQSDKRAIVQCAAKFVGLGDEVLQDLEQELDRAILIFDGLDELPIRHVNMARQDEVTLRHNAAEIIRLSNATRAIAPENAPAIRSIVTSRLDDYHEDRDSTLTATTYVLAGFTPPQVPEAIKKWHDAAKRAIEGKGAIAVSFAEELDERVHAVQAVLRANPDLANVCLTPLMLSILQSVYSDRDDLPSSVSQLCNRAVNWLLIEKHARLDPSFLTTSWQEWLGRAISKAGWEIHQRVANGAKKALSDDDLRKLVKETSSMRADSPTALELRDEAITRIAAHLRRGHGILVKVTDDQYDFAHNVFREVMAGRALGLEPVIKRRGYALDIKWHAPIRYWAGLKAVDEAGLHEISALVGELSPDCDAGNVAAILACGEILAEACAVSDEADFTRDLKARIATIRSQLVTLFSNSKLRFVDRVRIGDLLGVLGDPRLEKAALERTCRIEGGPAIVGRVKNHTTRNSKYENCPAAPSVTGDLRSFSIGSFLVTNSEFREFIESDGYRNQKFWPSVDGWSWVTGAPEILASLIGLARQAAPTHLSSEIQGHRIVQEDIPDHCERMVRRRQPLYWDDPAFNRANQPVVGINWWEAQAYCFWLEDKLKETGALTSQQHVRLPTEAEWETAARKCGGDGVYPWTAGLPNENAHIRAIAHEDEGHVPRSCAVGSFSFVPTNISAYDFVGNVWEWTASLASPYNADSFSQTIDYSGLGDRIARGSSWLSPEMEASQVTFRSFDPPYNAYEDLGLRIAITE